MNPKCECWPDTYPDRACPVHGSMLGPRPKLTPTLSSTDKEEPKEKA